MISDGQATMAATDMSCAERFASRWPPGGHRPLVPPSLCIPSVKLTRRGLLVCCSLETGDSGVGLRASNKHGGTCRTLRQEARETARWSACISSEMMLVSSTNLTATSPELRWFARRHLPFHTAQGFEQCIYCRAQSFRRHGIALNDLPQDPTCLFFHGTAGPGRSLAETCLHLSNREPGRPERFSLAPRQRACTVCEWRFPERADTNLDGSRPTGRSSADGLTGSTGLHTNCWALQCQQPSEQERSSAADSGLGMKSPAGPHAMRPCIVPLWQPF